MGKYRVGSHSEVGKRVSQEVCHYQAEDRVSQVLQPVIRCERRERRERPGVNGAYISLSKLGSSVKHTNHRLSEKTRALCRSIYITPIPTWMIFEETGLPSVETAMGEYLEPDIVIFDVRQRR